MNARDIMTSNPAVITPDEPLSQAVRLMADLNVGLIPIVADREGMSPLGVITDRDIVVRCLGQGHGGNCPARTHMSRNLITVLPDAPVAAIVNLMERYQVRRVLVVDQDRLIGVIAQADVALKEGPLEPLRVVELLERVSAPRLLANHRA
jgi:CBS domain-containing protein